jgi:RND family efflux transporter MFP subunit
MRRLLLITTLLLPACGRGGDKAHLPPAAPASSPIREPQDPATGDVLEPQSGGSGQFAGTLEARRRSTLSPRVGGVVTKVLVRDGDVVEQGAPLVALDLEDFALRVRQAQAGYDAAKAQVTAAEADWKRAKSLASDGSMPQAQFEGADARYLGAKAALDAAQVGLDMARKAERDATVRAPYAGVIVHRAISEGEYAAVMPPTQLLTIEETGVMELRLYVPADRTGGLRAGDKMRVQVPGMKDVTGTVMQVLPPPDPGQGSVGVLVEIEDPDRVLRPGMTAQATVVAKAELK